MRKLTLIALCTLATSPAIAGGWETGKLDTSFLYEEGNYVELSFGSLDYSVTATTQAGVTHPMAKDQTRLSTSGKFRIGKLDVGLSTFGSGAIQMDGRNPSAQASSGAPGCTPDPNIRFDCTSSVVPSANVKLDTQALMTRYSFSDNFSVIAGIREVKLKSSTVETLAAAYAINPTSKTGMVYGVAYEIPEYALRAEVVRSEAISMGLSGTATHSILGPYDLASTAALGVPEATTLKIQTGIAEDTLLMASAHKVKWSSSQVVIDVAVTPIANVIAADSLNTGSNFASTTSYSLGLGRKLSENTSASLTYSWEEGSGASATSPFTMSNGSKTLSIGVKHTIDALSVSGGLSYTKAGDVEVTHMAGPTTPSGYTASYSGNSVTAFGIKVGYNF